MARILGPSMRRVNRIRSADDRCGPAVRAAGADPGYPKRPAPRDEAAAKKLEARTLTSLYNAGPRWLADAHAALDAAISAACGRPADLRRLLKRNAGCEIR